MYLTLNKKEKQKDFHSLGTKDRITTLKLKQEYDSRYEKSFDGRWI